ncbi:holo-ACP synthase [Enterobacteriaceae endosymbiont of Donacia cincticornis]|uniref:holo-ACP synthase n=1 Tax=Enterobacteriaceae endosymbiont of Donacia cincticornis TaxID=2675773 RepID=UPI0014495A36|nr:holo-ACP synthase [Enterobacteriaceae endosymbiont of Donacia cincticornis]QJC36053.1 holo-ACP synthase [Enterobacteriaceae endosymbiont of Donacia cincticornis]
MNIFGIGIDIIEINRIKKIFMRFGNRFVFKILTKHELSIYKKNNNKIKILAKFFAAKEATVKALGTGFTNGIFFNQIEISNCKNGKPKIILYKQALNFLKNMNFKYKIHISFSDEKKYACTIVIIEINKTI